MKNRILSALLCAVMVLSMIPVGIIEAGADYTWGDFTFECGSINGGKWATITRYNGTGGNVVIPEKLTSFSGEYPVTGIGDNAFEGSTRLTTVTIPNGVNTIGKEAFYGCSRLNSIKIPNTVTTIGEQAFEVCLALLKVYFAGTQSQWSNISIGSGNDSLLKAEIIYYDPNNITLTGISLATLPTKTEYYIGEAFDASGLTLTAAYMDGTTKTINEGFTVSGFDSSAAGTRTLTVEYQGCQTTFDITVTQASLPTQPTVPYDPSAFNLIVDSVNCAAGDDDVEVAVYVENNPGFFAMSLEKVFPSELKYTGSDVADSLIQLTDVYHEEDDTWGENILVESLQLTSSRPKKSTDYTADGDIFYLYFDIPDDAVTGDYTVSFKVTSANNSALEYLHNDINVIPGLIHVNGYTVTNLSVNTYPAKTFYNLGEEMDLTGLTLTAATEGGETFTVTEGFTVSGFDSSSVGEKTVTVTYAALSTTFRVTVDNALDVGFYKGDRAQSEWLAPTQEGKVFAGWYADETYNEVYTGTTGRAFAKFVDARVMGVKAQKLVSSDSSKATLRFISTVSDTDLASAGFELTVGEKTVTRAIRNVYCSITAAGATVSPSGVSGSTDSNYITAFKLSNIPSSQFGTDISVRSFWRTPDGTTVMEENVKTVNVNMFLFF